MMQDILKRINKIAGVRGTMIVGMDGLPIASDIADGGVDAQTFGAVASSVASTLTGSLQRMKQGKINSFTMNGTQGIVVMMTVEEALLLTLLRKDANMGMVLVELKEAAMDLADILG